MGVGGDLRLRLIRLDELAGLRRQVDLGVAPPAWLPGHGTLRPLVTSRSQRLAVWGAAAVAVTLGISGMVSGHAGAAVDYFSLSVIGVPSLSGVVLGAALGSRRRRRAPALRWLAADTPVVQHRILSPSLVVELMLIVVTCGELAGGLPPSAFVGLVAYAVLGALAGEPARRRWSAIERTHQGRVVRVSRPRRIPGTSALYFQPRGGGDEPRSQAAAVDGNPYRAPSRTP